MIDHAIKLKPKELGPRWTKAFGYLMSGDFANGWPAFECRLDLLNLTRPGIDLWNGEKLKGKILLVYGEQGLGDVIQFVRYLKGLPKDTGKLLFETPIELRRLLEWSIQRWDFSGFMPGFTIEFRNHGSTKPYTADYQVSLLSLPRLVSDVPLGPYLLAPPPQTSTLSLTARAPGVRRVGICWAGNPTHRFDHERSTTLQEMFKALARPGVELYSLQVGPAGRKDDETLIGARGFVRDLAPSLRDFSDTAAAIMALDCVVTVDTSVAHLAGALGQETHLLLPFNGLDWRWGLASAANHWSQRTYASRCKMSAR